MKQYESALDSVWNEIDTILRSIYVDRDQFITWLENIDENYQIRSDSDLAEPPGMRVYNQEKDEYQYVQNTNAVMQQLKRAAELYKEVDYLIAFAQQ